MLSRLVLSKFTATVTVGQRVRYRVFISERRNSSNPQGRHQAHWIEQQAHGHPDIGYSRKNRETANRLVELL
jgi:hypothetical protein